MPDSVRSTAGVPRVCEPIVTVQPAVFSLMVMALPASQVIAVIFAIAVVEVGVKI